MQETTLKSEHVVITSQESLKNGIWPRSIPLWMAAVYVALFIIRPWDKLFPWMGAIHFERIYFICFIVVTFFSGKRQGFYFTSQSVAVLSFLAAIGLSCLFAFNPSLSWDSFYIYLTLVIFYFMLIIVIRSPYDLMFMVLSYIGAMTMYLAKAQWEFFVHGQNRYDMGVIRMIGIENTYGGPNELAMSIIVSLPMLVFLWSFRKEISQTWPLFYQKWLYRFLVIYTMLAVTSIILTNSRSGMVGFILFLLLLSIFRGQSIGKKFGYIFLGIMIIGILWAAMPEESKGRFRTIWGEGEGRETEWATASAEGRIEGFRAGISMFKNFPVIGVGPGSFIDYRVSHVDGIALNAHNLIGQVLGETGMLGFTTFIIMISITAGNFRRVRAIARSSPDSTFNVYYGFALAGRDALILLFFLGLFGHNLMRFNWLWLAAFSSLLLQITQERFNILIER